MRTKAAQFAQSAESAGWDVRRKKFVSEDGQTCKRVIATRGREGFDFVWATNAETGRDVFVSGRHALAEHVEPFANVKAAERALTAKETAIRVVTNRDGESVVVRLPFDIENADDVSVMVALAGHKVRWQNTLTGNFEDGVCPPTFDLDSDRTGQFRIEPGKTAVNEGERIVSFMDHGSFGGFRAFRLSALVEVR